MIQMCYNSNLDISLLPDDWCGTFIKSRFLAYGGNASFAPFYQDDDGNVVSLLDGNAMLSGGFSNVNEWAAFFTMHPDIVTITGEETVVRQLSNILQIPATVKQVMQYKNTGNFIERSVVLQPSIREMYSLLKAVFDAQMPPFENWYVDVSHRIRHELCNVAGVKKADVLVSTAMTVAESETAAIIGAVATHPEYRKRGYASMCIRSLVDRLTKEKDFRTIWISPKNDNALRLYSSLGFTVSGKIGQISIKEGY